MFELIYITSDGGNGWCNTYAIASDSTGNVYTVVDSAENSIAKFKTLAEALDNCAEICQPTSRLLKRQLARVVEPEFTKQVSVHMPTCVSILYDTISSTEAVLSLLPNDHVGAIKHIANEVRLNRPEWTIPELSSLEDALHLWVKSTTEPVLVDELSFGHTNPLDSDIQYRMLKSLSVMGC